MHDRLSYTTPTARKTHLCWCCGAMIRSGQIYVRDKYVEYGSFYTFILCQACEAITNKVYLWTFGDELDPDAYYGWAEYNTDDPQAVAFMKRWEAAHER